MPSIVYGASRGSYSDYAVCRIFATKAEAVAWVAERGTIKCRYCDGSGKRTEWELSRPGQDCCGLFVKRDCNACDGAGSYSDYDIEEFPFGPD